MAHLSSNATSQYYSAQPSKDSMRPLPKPMDYKSLSSAMLELGVGMRKAVETCLDCWKVCRGVPLWMITCAMYRQFHYGVLTGRYSCRRSDYQTMISSPSCDQSRARARCSPSNLMALHRKRYKEWRSQLQMKWLSCELLLAWEASAVSRAHVIF